VRVEIAPSVEGFVELTGLPRQAIEAAGVVGAGTGDRIVVLSPRLLARGYPWRDALNHHYLRLLLARLGANRAPAWLAEGVARLGEVRWRAADPEVLDDLDRSLVARALREGALIPLAALERPFAPSAGGAARLAAAESALAAEHLLDGWGVDGLRRLLAALAAGPADQGPDQALRAAVGMPLAQFEERWRLMLEKRGFREIPGAALPPVHLAGSGDPEDGDPAEWQPPAAQRHLRLGDLLLERGNLKAGLMEYAQARAAAPGSPYVQVKAAQALLKLGQSAEAAAAARAAVRLAPGYTAASVTLGAALAALGDLEGAVAARRAALELNPFDPFVWRDLGRALRRLGRAQEAQRASVTALRLVPGNEAFQRSVMHDE
jgi:tetratricopeptide (TPR) repeat protein